MPMEFMLELSQGELPCTVEDTRGIDCARVLAAAGLVDAMLPEVDAADQRARVLAITPEGRAALRMAYPGREFHFARPGAPAGLSLGKSGPAPLMPEAPGVPAPRWMSLLLPSRAGPRAHRDAVDSQIRPN